VDDACYRRTSSDTMCHNTFRTGRSR
jgi:hypothetical protein